jgi:hypothetical protein
MRPPHTTDDIQSKTLGSNTFPGGSLKCWDHPNELLSVPAVTQPVTLYCIRPKAIRGSLEEAHLSDTRFPQEHQFILRRLHQVDASKAHESSEDINVLPWLSEKITILEAADHAAAASSSRICRPVFQATVSAPAGTCPVSRNRQMATSSFRANATMPIRRCRLLPLAKRF